MFNLMLITNDTELAKFAVENGVTRVFVDLEINGKQERQGHLDTVISKHQMEDVKKIRSVLTKGDLLVRINPLFEGTQKEVDTAISYGADIIMLPMFQSAQEVEQVAKYIAGRAAFIPLVETANAAANLEEITKVEGVTELYIGLNDLHRDLQLKFMFEPLANGMLDKLSAIMRASNIPFGFGGIARIGEGVLPAELILAEHSRLGSSCAILSRTFHRRSKTLSDLNGLMCLSTEIEKVHHCLAQHGLRNADAEVQDCAKVKDIVSKIVEGNIA